MKQNLDNGIGAMNETPVRFGLTQGFSPKGLLTELKRCMDEIGEIEKALDMKYGVRVRVTEHKRDCDTDSMNGVRVERGMEVIEAVTGETAVVRDYGFHGSIYKTLVHDGVEYVQSIEMREGSFLKAFEDPDKVRIIGEDNLSDTASVNGGDPT